MSSEKDKKFQKIVEVFSRVVNKINRVEKDPRCWGIGHCLLYKSEIQAIEIIGLYPDSNMTELANKLGITKGALSQVVNKLNKKGYLKKTRLLDNEKEIFLRLTEKGNEAFDAHKVFHDKYFQELVNLFYNLPDEQTDFLNFAFKSVDDMLTKFLDDNPD